MLRLRQEIHNLLHSENAYLDDETIDVDYCINEILKMIEKRIDELYPQNPIDTQYKTGYYNAICKVMEILK